MCLLTAAPLLALLIIGSVLDRNRSIAAAEQTLHEAAFAAARDQTEIAVGAAGVLHVLGKIESVRLMTPGACNQIVSLAADLDRRIDSVAVIRPTGTIACSSHAEIPRPSLADRAYFRTAISARVGEGFTTEVVRSRISDRPTLIAAVPIPGSAPNDAPIGVISASIDLGWLAEISTRLPPEWRTSALLINVATATVIAQSSEAAMIAAKDGRPRLRGALPAQAGGNPADEIIHAVDADGRAVLVALAPIRVGETRLLVEIGAQRCGVLSDANARVEVGVAIALTAIVLTVLLAWALAQIGLLGPIGTLVEAANEIAVGNLEVRAPNASRVRELRTLGLAFNRMAQRLQMRDREITSMQAALTESEEHHRLLAENATDMITRFNRDFIRTYVSPACNDLLGYCADELVGREPGNIVHPDDWMMLDQALNLPLKSGEERAKGTYRAFRKDGTVLWLESRGRRLPDGTGFVVVTRDVSERMAFELELEAANRQLEELATHDPLTGLANRRRLQSLLEAEYRRARRMQLPMSVAFVDVDHFKAYNDAFGHPAGDLCLQALAAAIDGCLRRPADLAARVGGEEFMILLPATDSAGADLMGRSIRSAVHDLNLQHTASAFGIVTVSIGTATFTPDGNNNIAQLIDAADAALYQVKRGGRDGVLAASG